MKKVLSVIVCIAMIFCLAACGKTKIGNLKAYEVGNYTFQLPETYEYNDLEEVKAEDDCIAMLTDKNGKLPDLWIYEDPLDGDSLKDHLLNTDEDWFFTEFSLYDKDGEYLAYSVYDEDWYGEALVNESFYRIEDGDKVINFDFAYNASDDREEMHAYALAIAISMGF